jgi:hypothetical protein
MISKKDLAGHLKKECPHRAYECSLCGEEGKYSDIIGIHLKDCSMGAHAIPCEEAAGHLATPEHASVSCQEETKVCKAKPKKASVAKDLQATSILLRNPEWLSSVTGLDADIVKTATTQLERLLSGDVPRSLPALSVTKTCYIRVANCRSYMESGYVYATRAFYTAPRCYSYCMIVAVYLKGTANPNYASIQATLVRGAWDAVLTKPFVGEISFMLVNNRSKDDVYCKTLSVPLEDDIRVGSPPMGFENYISHQDLCCNFDTPVAASSSKGKGRLYIKNDVLNFKVVIRQPETWLKFHK